MRDDQLDALLATADLRFQESLRRKMDVRAGLSAILGPAAAPAELKPGRTEEPVPAARRLEGVLVALRRMHVDLDLTTFHRAKACLAALTDGLEHRTLSRDKALELVRRALDDLATHEPPSADVVWARGDLQSVAHDIERLFDEADDHVPWLSPW